MKTMCACCGQDIEGNAREGWRDRGNGRECLPFRARDGDLVRPAGLTHSPKLTPRAMLRPGPDIEVGCIRKRGSGRPGRPSYRWARGWEVRDPDTGRYCTPMRYREALAHARDMLQRGAA